MNEILRFPPPVNYKYPVIPVGANLKKVKVGEMRNLLLNSNSIRIIMIYYQYIVIQYK